MEKIDIQNFKKYYQNNDGNGTVARVGHVNAVIDTFTEDVTTIQDDLTTVQNDVDVLESRLDEITSNVFADNAAALLGGLAVGDLYSTDGSGAAPLNVAGIVMVVV